MNKPTDTESWQALLEHSKRFQQDDFHLSDLFSENADRGATFSIHQPHLMLDFSKNYVDQETLQLLVELALQCRVPAAIEAMFDGEMINASEQRAALHVRLRDPSASNTQPEVADTLARMESFVTAVHSGNWTGYSGNKISNIVNIGIGGSDLGPALVTDALTSYATGHVNVHFVSNVDPVHLDSVLKHLQTDTTLFIIASKSFTTLETRQNADAARAWILDAMEDERAIAKHFVAITTNLEAATAFGIPESNLFPLWDWVGGRFSLWSAIGLPIALSIGMDNFRQLLAGAHEMDEHFRQADLAQNMPVVMALLCVWYRAFFNCHSSAVLPYSQRLGLFPAFLQQLSMESLGKQVDNEGSPISTPSGEVVWGTAGSNGQHAYFQLLHQGSEFIAADFIAVAEPVVATREEQHRHLLANCFSQSMALMNGTVVHDSADQQAPHKIAPGNRPSNTLLLKSLTPASLGSLIALYEHKVYVQSVLWNINAFDQWGVELGKLLSKQTFEAISNNNSDINLDSSTANLIKQLQEWNQ